MNKILKSWWPVLVLLGVLVLFRGRLAAAVAPVMAPVSGGSSSAGRKSFLGLTHLQDGRPMPRGMRNNNPGNIRVTADNWQGKIPVEQNTDNGKAFEQFESYAYGIRAMIKTLKSYHSKHGKKSIIDIVYRWAPPGDNNDSMSYARTVGDKTGFVLDRPITWNKKNVGALVIAMCAVENGLPDAVTQADFDEAWKIV